MMAIRFLLLASSLLCSVLALPLASRDVVSPHITSPTAGTVWHVGQTQTVTWNATGLPVNQTNPVGMLVLGYLYNNSENLMLDSPLATNLNYSVGQAQITVPDVPTQTDYIVVLFGDSGNASPEFTIINDASNPVSTTIPPIPLPGSSGSSPQSSANPNSSGNSGGSSPVTGVLPTTTAPSQTTPHSSTVVTVTPSSTPSSTQSNAAWQKHVPSVGTPLGIALALIYFTST